MAFAIAIHTLAAAIWVGGMFFAFMVLRPSARPLEAPVRLRLWERVFSRFFPWVWTSSATLLASGLGVVFWGYGGFALRSACGECAYLWNVCSGKSAIVQNTIAPIVQHLQSGLN